MNIEFTKINYQLPEDYLMFLSQNPDGAEFCFDEYQDESGDDGYEGRYWNLMGIDELKESWEMKGIGTASNYNCLTLYIKCFQECSGMNKIESDEGFLPCDRVSKGFVVGSENGDYLYLDPSDGFSVWVYFNDGGDVLKVASSFSEWLTKTN